MINVSGAREKTRKYFIKYYPCWKLSGNVLVWICHLHNPCHFLFDDFSLLLLLLRAAPSRKHGLAHTHTQKPMYMLNGWSLCNPFIYHSRAGIELYSTCRGKQREKIQEINQRTIKIRRVCISVQVCVFFPFVKNEKSEKKDRKNTLWFINKAIKSIRSSVWSQFVFCSKPKFTSHSILGCFLLSLYLACFPPYRSIAWLLSNISFSSQITFHNVVFIIIIAFLRQVPFKNLFINQFNIFECKTSKKSKSIIINKFFLSPLIESQRNVTFNEMMVLVTSKWGHWNMKIK